MTTLHRLTTFALSLAAPAALAWGQLGHETVGWIAEGALDPKGREFVYRILGSEPLMVSANYPDIVRSDERFGAFSPYHYFDDPKAPQSAATIVDQAPALLMGDTLDANQKRVLLRYLAHVVGDVHMPLHVGNGVDRGANLCDVMWRSPETGTYSRYNLHAVWDEALFRNIGDEFQKLSGADPNQKRWFGYKELGTMILTEDKGRTSYARASKSRPAEWYREDHDLYASAYPDPVRERKAWMKNPALRAYCRSVDPATKQVVDGAYDAEKIPQLNEAYVTQATAAIKQRLLLGGLRLAGILNRAGAQMKLPDHDAAAAKASLEALLIRNP
jgi:hypothetical protein